MKTSASLSSIPWVARRPTIPRLSNSLRIESWKRRLLDLNGTRVLLRKISPPTMTNTASPVSFTTSSTDSRKLSSCLVKTWLPTW